MVQRSILIKTLVLIVDDEVYARKRLRRFLQQEPDVEILEDCTSAEQAVLAIERQKPDLVFLDIQLPEMSGFDVLKEVGPERMPPVVFVTAHSQFALQAFEAHALGYLLKPFPQTRFHEIFDRARAYLRGHSALETNEKFVQLLDRLETGRDSPRIAVRTEGRILFVQTGEIDWIEAVGNYVRLHIGADRHLMRCPLHVLETKLSPQKFVRVHRSAVVNVDRIKEIQPYFKGIHVIILQGGAKLVASRSGMLRLQEAMDDVGSDRT
jgi:two-component system, LytTR family, response regulator